MLIRILVLTLLSSPCYAVDISPELYITSYHTRSHDPQGREYNQFNPGGGVHITEDVGNFHYGVRAGEFENSFKQPTEVLAATAEYCVGDNYHACGGVMVGGIHGYSKTQFVQFAAAPTIEIGYDRLSIDFTAYPTEDRNAAVITGWLKYRAWRF